MAQEVVPTVGDVLAMRLREYRKARGMSLGDLAEACEKAGMPTLTEPSLVNLERPLVAKRPRRKASVEEWLVLSHVLGVHPALLILPVGEIPRVEIIPGQFHDTWNAFRWVTAEATLDGATVDEDPAARAAVLFRQHVTEVDQFTALTRRVAGYAGLIEMVEPENLTMSTVLLGFSFKGWLPEDRVTAEDLLRSIKDVRSSIRRAGLTPPPLPKSLTRLEG